MSTFNQLTSDQTTRLVIGAAGHQEVAYRAPGPGGTGNVGSSFPMEITLVNLGPNVANFRLDGQVATAADRVLMANERLTLSRRATDVSVFSTLGGNVEVTFSV